MNRNGSIVCVLGACFFALVSQAAYAEVLLELPGEWKFRQDRDKIGEDDNWFSPGIEKVGKWKNVPVGTFWPDYQGDGWYAVDTKLPSGDGKKVWLVFGAIDENYTLWINGERVGDNLDADPDLIWDKAVAEEITGKYSPGKINHIVVRVKNAAGSGGIWKPVYLVKGPVGKLPDKPAPATHSPAKWLEPTDEYVTPHIAWAKPTAQGPMKALFITSRVSMRGIVELCQRFEIEREVFAIELPHVFVGKVNPAWHKMFPGTDPQSMERRLREKLALDYDCIFIGNIPWSVLPEWARSSILKKVKAGTGLVGYIRRGESLNWAFKNQYKTLEHYNQENDTNYTSWEQVTPFEKDDPLEKAVAAKSNVDLKSVIGAFPFTALPAFKKYKDFDEFARETVDIAGYGEGRIALLKGYACPTYQIVAPGIMSSFTDWYMVHYDYYLALAGHLMQWAVRGPPDPQVRQPDSPVIQIDGSKRSPITFSIGVSEKGTGTVEFALRHAESGEVVQRAKRTWTNNDVSATTTYGFHVDPVPAGPYFADLWVKRAGKTAAFGSLFVKVTSSSHIGDVLLTGDAFGAESMVKHYALADAVTGRVTINGPSKDLTVQVTQRDNHGRLVARERYPLKDVGGQAQMLSFSLQPLSPLSVLQHLDIHLMNDETVLDTYREDFTYNNLFLPDDDVHYLLWEGCLVDTYLHTAAAKVIRKAGFDLWWNQHSTDTKRITVAALLRENMHEFPNLFYPPPFRPRLMGHPIPAEGGGHIRKPCLTDPDYLKKLSELYRGVAATSRMYSTAHYTFGSESEFTDGELEICFSETCIARFREYLRDQYKTLDQLNEEYGSDYTDWFQITPIEYHTAIETNRIPLWFDFRRSMDSVWADYIGAVHDAITEVIPQAKVGFDASTDAGHSPKLGGIGGDDYWKISQGITLYGPYFWPLQLDCARDFARPGTMIGGGWHGGYPGVFRAGRKALWHRWFTWYTFLRGANSFWIFQGSGGPEGSPDGVTLAQDLTWYDFMHESHATVNRIQEGIGKLVMAMDRPDDGVAVLYSPSSMLMANLTPEFPQRWDSLSALSVILPESNFQYRMVSSSQLEQGILKQGNIKLLYLPNAQGLSPTEVREIRDFTATGGAVVADLRPAVADDHGKTYAQGALDELFGISQNTLNALPIKDTIRLDDTLDGLRGVLPEASADGSLRLAGGEALTAVGGAPALIVNDFGKGRTTLLNFAVSDYVVDKLMLNSRSSIRFSDAETAASTAALFRAVFARSELRPAVRISPQTPGCHLYRFEMGNAQLLGLLQEIPPYLPGIGAGAEKDLDKFVRRSYQERELDNVDEGAMKELDKFARHSNAVTLHLDRDKHLYDVLDGTYLGLTREISRAVQPGEPHLLAALEYKVDSIFLVPTSKSFKQGEKLEFSVTINTDGPPADLHVVRIELTDPDGQLAEMYTQKQLVKAGEHADSIQLSLDEKPGKWKMSARDIATGVSTQVIVEVVRD